jgi:hypothetical protein
MANTYVWKVGQCDRLLETGMITTLHYTISATDEEGVYSSGAYGSVGLEPADAKNMVPYDDVSESQAVSWAQAALGGADKVAEIHAALDKALAEKKSPTTGTGTPWSA